MASARWRRIANRFRYGCRLPMPMLTPKLFERAMKASAKMLGVQLDAKGRRII